MDLQMVAKSIRRLMTSPFKTVYFQNFCKNYCCKTIEATIMKTISNDSKLIQVIKGLTVGPCCLLFSCTNLFKIKIN